MRQASLGLSLATWFAIWLASAACAAGPAAALLAPGPTTAPSPPDMLSPDMLSPDMLSPDMLSPAGVERVRTALTDDADLVAGDRPPEAFGSGDGRLRPVGRLGSGLELSCWITEYVGPSADGSLRVQFAVNYDF